MTATAAPNGQANSLSTGDQVVVIAGDHNGRSGVVTKVHGPKTVEVRMNAGFTLWRVKVANLRMVRSAA